MRRHSLRNCFLGILFGCLAFQVSAQSFEEGAPTFQSRDEALQVLEEPVPQGLSRREVQGIYQRKDLAAQFLGDDVLREKMLRDWVRDVGSPQAKGSLGGWLVYNSDRPQEGIDLIRENINQLRAENKLPGALMDQAKLIETYSSLRMNDEADEAIRRAELDLRELERLPDQGELPYWKGVARALVLQAKAGHLWRAARYDEAAKVVQESNRLFSTLEPLWPTLKNIRRKNNDMNAWLRGIIRYATIRIDQGELFEAERAIRQAVYFSEKRARLGEHTGLLRTVSRLKFRQGDYEGGLKYSKEALQVFQERRRSERSQPYLWQRNTMKSHLAGLQKWGDLYEEIQRDDELVRNDKLLTRIVRNPGARWLAYLKNSRIDDAIKVCRDWLKDGDKVFGPNHPYTAFRRGALAAALAHSDRPSDRQEALALFRLAYKDLTVSATLLNQQDYPYRLWLKNFIFESYIQLLLTLPEANQPSIQSEIFSVASFTSGSSVQQAINDAAARTKISDSALAELVRKDQDAARELEALYDFVSALTTNRNNSPRS